MDTRINTIFHLFYVVALCSIFAQKHTWTDNLIYLIISWAHNEKRKPEKKNSFIRHIEGERKAARLYEFQQVLLLKMGHLRTLFYHKEKESKKKN